MRLVAGRHLGGWRRDRPDHRDFMMHLPAVGALPPVSQLDWQIPIFDQGSLGSCTANAGCSAVEYLDWRAHGTARIFSRLYLYARTRELEGTPLSNDSGAEIRDVFKALRLLGICFEATWPYSDQQGWSLEPSSEAGIEAKQHEALFYFRCPSLLIMKASIFQGFPVVFGFSVPESMMSDQTAQDGEVHYPQPTEAFDGGHAVCAIGYDDAHQIGAETGAVCFVNSWGNGWGQRGLGWLPYRYFIDQLATDLWTLRKMEL